MCTGSSKPTTELLNDLSKEVPYTCDWYSLGLCLLKEGWIHKLKAIGQSNPDNPEKCCEEMLEFCLSSFLAVTWDKMIIALKKLNLNEPVQKIEKDNSIKG